MPRIAPFRNTFSRPVSSGWNPVPTSSSDPTRPRTIAWPAVGSVMRDRILSSVLLPGAVAPDDADDLALARLSNETSRSAQITHRLRPAASAAERA